MNRVKSNRTFWAGIVLTGIAALSGCAPKPAPTPTPPPRIVIPPRPQPPMGAAPNLSIPPLNAYGIRETVNTGLSSAQAIWNFRSAYNVAALNCVGLEYAPILTGYGEFLKTHSKTLSTANRELDKRFKDEFGSRYIRERETYQTQVYNYFALPPVHSAFCDAALAVTVDLKLVPQGELETFAPTALAKFDSVFREFFNSYDQYKSDLVAWKARYEPTPTPIQLTPIQQTQAGAPNGQTSVQ